MGFELSERPSYLVRRPLLGMSADSGKTGRAQPHSTRLTGLVAPCSRRDDTCNKRPGVVNDWLIERNSPNRRREFFTLEERLAQG